MRINDAITGLVLVIFALAEVAYASTFPSLHGQSYGPDLFPTLIGAGLMGCGLILIVRGIRQRRIDSQSAAASGESTVPWIQFEALTTNRDAALNFFLVLIALLLYIVFSSSVGFIPMSLTIMSVLLYRLGSTLVVSVLVSILATLVIQLVFAKVLLVPLPPGLLKGLVW